MSAVIELEYVTDRKGQKTKVLMRLDSFQNLQEEIEDLEDALALERAKKEATGFKTWKSFLKELRKG
jgi:hypothetical protein